MGLPQVSGMLHHLGKAKLMNVMGIDVSTQSCTVEVRSEDGFALVSRARRALPATHPPVSEQSVEDWWTALKGCMADLTESGLNLVSIEAISVSGQCHGLVALDGHGQAIRPVKLWNDTTADSQIQRLIGRFGREYWIQKTGSCPTSAFTIAKLAWLIEHEPATVQRIRHILLPHDYITYLLTGEYVTDRSEASGTGYFDSTRNEYDYELLYRCFDDTVDFIGKLPYVGHPEEQAGTLTKRAAEELGLSVGIPVGVGGGDQHMAAVGLGVEPGDIVASMGTSGVVFTTWDSPIHDLSGWVNGVADAEGGWLPLVCVLNCTKVTNWMASMLGVSVQELDAIAYQGDDLHTPMMAAYLDGERSPSLPGAKACIMGIDNETSREDLARMAFAGVVCGMMRGIDALRHCGIELDGRFIMCGGGARSMTYRQLFADYTGKTVTTVDADEATARGACVQAWNLLNHGDDLRKTASMLRPVMAEAVEPRASDPQWPHIKEQYLRVAGFAAETERR